MIVFAGSRLKATDNDGNTQSIKVIGPEQDTLKIGDDINRELLYNIIKELKILNYQISIMTDNIVKDDDIEMSKIYR